MYLGVNEILPEKQPYTSIVLGTGVIWDISMFIYMKKRSFCNRLLPKIAEILVSKVQEKGICFYFSICFDTVLK